MGTRRFDTSSTARRSTRIENGTTANQSVDTTASVITLWGKLADRKAIGHPFPYGLMHGETPVHQEWPGRTSPMTGK